MRTVVQDVPPSLNKVLRMHWAKRRKLRDVWCMFMLAGFGVDYGPSKKKKVLVTLCHSRLYDKDNAYGACKVIFDALKRMNLIVDDSAEWLEANVEQEKCPHKKRHTIIEMEDEC